MERIFTYIVLPHLAKIWNPYHLISSKVTRIDSHFPLGRDCSHLMVATLYLPKEVTEIVKRRCLDSLSVSFVVRFHIQRTEDVRNRPV